MSDPMSRSDWRGGFSPVNGTQDAEQQEQGRTMQERHPVPASEMVRIPGLFRRWELPEVLNNHHAFRIEDAGTHQDGTPLLAIYAACDGDGPTGCDASVCIAGVRSSTVGTVSPRAE